MSAEDSLIPKIITAYWKLYISKDKIYQLPGKRLTIPKFKIKLVLAWPCKTFFASAEFNDNIDMV